MAKSLFSFSIVCVLFIFSAAIQSHAGELTKTPSKAPQVKGSEPLRPAHGTGVRPANEPRPQSRPHALRPDFTVLNVRYYPPQEKILFDVVNRADIYKGQLTVLIRRRLSPKLEEWKRPTVNLPRNGKIAMSVPFHMPDIDFVCSLDVEITVDPQNRIVETNENNNSFNGPIYRDVRAYFLILPYKLSLVLQRKRFTRACNSSSGPFVIRKDHLGTDYSHVDKTARITVGIPMKNCGSNTGPGDLSFDVFRIKPGGASRKLIELPDFVRNVRLSPGQDRFYEKTIMIKVKRGTYKAVVRKGANVLCTIEWQFHNEFF